MSSSVRNYEELHRDKIEITINRRPI